MLTRPVHYWRAPSPGAGLGGNPEAKHVACGYLLEEQQLSVLALQCLSLDECPNAAIQVETPSVLLIDVPLPR